MIQYQKSKNIFQSKEWFSSGWDLFKKQPVTWVFMVFIFFVFYVIGTNIYLGQYVLALLTPILSGGIFLAAYQANKGERVAFKYLFLMFKCRQRFKQLLIIGTIGACVVGLTELVQVIPGSDYQMRYGSSSDTIALNRNATSLGDFLSSIIVWAWVSAIFFSIPLVSIKNKMAIESLTSSLGSVITNLMPLGLCYIATFFLVIVSVIPFGLGLLVTFPILFCTAFFAFKSIYLDCESEIQN